LQKSPGLRWRSIGRTVFTYKKLTAGCIASRERILNNDGTAAHPTQKPIAVIEWLLSVGCKSVLDPFMGTGTTGIACINYECDFTGIEIDENYFGMAQRRIAAAQAQTRMELAA
jgi:site-specific DNA-methyltransferase (adenine-specific)/modification methylase